MGEDEGAAWRVTNDVGLQELELVEARSAVVDEGPEAVGGEAVLGVLQVVSRGAAEGGEALGLGELIDPPDEVNDVFLVPANDVEQGDERVLGAIALAVPAMTELRLLPTLRERVLLGSGVTRLGPRRDEYVFAPVLQCPQIASDAVVGVDFSGGEKGVVVERSNPELPQQVVWRHRFRLSKNAFCEIRGGANGDGRRANGALDDRCPDDSAPGGMFRRAVQYAFIDVDGHGLFFAPRVAERLLRCGSLGHQVSQWLCICGKSF